MYTPSLLPPSSRLPIEFLSASFHNVTNSYKFFWFLSLLEYVQETGAQVVSVDELLVRMVARVWYPVNYFRLSFGKQDRLSQIALAIKHETDLSVDSDEERILQTIRNCLAENPEISGQIKSLGKYVPYRFLRPFFQTQLRGERDWKINGLIEQYAEDAFSDEHKPCLYRFLLPNEGDDRTAIELHSLWLDYLRSHFPIVSGFCHWNLLNYLQKNNPNVPNIAGKLHKPTRRKLRKNQAFWKLVIGGQGATQCIYSRRSLGAEGYSLDHFLPWSFVGHDLMWNIVPVMKSANSSKGDHLPDFSLYFESLAKLQYDAIQIVGEVGEDRFLEDYVLLFKKSSAQEVCSLPFNVFRQTLHENLAPQLQIAKNMGFAANWVYSLQDTN